MKKIKDLNNAELISIIEHDDSQNLIAAARELINRKVENIPEKLLNILKTTQNKSIRNELALLLSDEKNPSLFNVISDLLEDQRTINSRGTLLYALSGYDCSSIVPLLVDFVIEGKFEISNQAFNLITEINTNLDLSVWNNSKKKIEDALQLGTSENASSLKKLLLLFNGKS